MTTRPSLVVFTRDLRVRDHPALSTAAASGPVVALFVFDPVALRGTHASPNRVGFLLDALEDLDSSLRRLGGELVVRHGDWVAEVTAVATAVGASGIHVSDDVSGYARGRLSRLADALAALPVELVRHPGVTVVDPGAVSPAGGGTFKVFTAYHRRWLAHPWRPVVATPTELSAVPDVATGELPTLDALVAGTPSPQRRVGGETAGTDQLRSWLAGGGLADYRDGQDDLAGDRTSHLAAHLHFGTLSPLEVASRLRDRPAADPFLRQLAWRDFFHQVLAARPDASRADYRDRGDQWVHDEDGFEAWRTGQTGYPMVDAGMRQLLAEGEMHNRARMVVASFLTKDLGIDWRLGAAHFMRWLVDGDVAVNQLNWQWVAGTGTDANPHRIFNPTTQGRRFDPAGEYLRRYLPELSPLASPDIHEPTIDQRRDLRYPRPIVDHHDAVAAHKARRASSTD